MLAKCIGRHKHGLLAIQIIGLFLLLIFIRSLFVRSVQASVLYNILYFHDGNTMNQNAGASQVSTKISLVMTLTIRPNADGTFTAWTGTYVDVDEETQNGDTDYISCTATAQESFHLEDHTTESGSISNVRVVIWAMQGGNEYCYLTLVIGGTEYQGTRYRLSATAYTEYTNDWGTNPAGGDWTWTAIDALEAGVTSETSGPWGGTMKVTQLYVEVTYSYDSSISWSASYWTDNWWVGVSSSWSVVFYFDASGGELATGTVTVTVGLTGLPGADKTPVSQTGVSCSGDTGSSQTTTHDVSGWTDRDATTTWLNDDEAANPSRTLSVTIEITSGGPIAIEYDAASSPGDSRLNTGTIVPENFLQLIFAAPFIPLIAKAVARWSERGKRSVGRDGEKRGRQ